MLDEKASGPAENASVLPRDDTVVDRLRNSALANDLSFLLARANALSLAAAREALATHGLRNRSYAVLALAVSGDGCSQREIAEFLRLDPSQVVALVDGLEKQLLVRREGDPRDRRAKIVVATEAGGACYARARLDAAIAQRSLHQDLTGRQRDEFAEMLRILAFPS